MKAQRPLMPVVSENIRTWRARRGMSQGDLASAYGSSQAYVSKLETGKSVAGVETLSKLARALQIPVSELTKDVTA